MKPNGLLRRNNYVKEFQNTERFDKIHAPDFSKHKKIITATMQFAFYFITCGTTENESFDRCAKWTERGER